jgi:hypothetical protein
MRRPRLVPETRNSAGAAAKSRYGRINHCRRRKSLQVSGLSAISCHEGEIRRPRHRAGTVDSGSSVNRKPQARPSTVNRGHARFSSIRFIAADGLACPSCSDASGLFVRSNKMRIYTERQIYPQAWRNLAVRRFCEHLYCPFSVPRSTSPIEIVASAGVANVPPRCAENPRPSSGAG